MVFSSLEFILLFLPITIFAYYTCLRFKRSNIALGILVVASLFYYAYWDPKYILVIITSIVFNFSFAYFISSCNGASRKALFIIGLLVNIASLVYFKYTGFMLSTINSIASTQLPILNIVMPIGISFFTFQQIAYFIKTWVNNFGA